MKTANAKKNKKKIFYTAYFRFVEIRNCCEQNKRRIEKKCNGSILIQYWCVAAASVALRYSVAMNPGHYNVSPFAKTKVLASHLSVWWFCSEATSLSPFFYGRCQHMNRTDIGKANATDELTRLSSLLAERTGIYGSGSLFSLDKLPGTLTSSSFTSSPG